MTEGSVLVLGGGSDIGLAVARAYAADGRAIRLAARRPEALEAEASDIGLRHGVEVTLHRFDALETDDLPAFVDGLPELPAIAVCAVGLLGDQAGAERDPALAARVMRSNYEGPALVLGILAERMEARGSGVIVGISSVAGDRGRATNYVYGSAKAGFTAFLSGLRNRLAKKGVHVLTVKPGFVATRMTEGMDLPARLTATPEQVAERTLRAAASGSDEIHVLRIWWLVMAVIRAIPEPIFKRMRI